MNKPEKNLPTPHPLDLPATEIASGIRSGQFTSEAVVAESIRRAKSANATLNAFTVIREEQALASARKADRILSEGGTVGSLHGVPFAAKDLTPTKGDLTTLGSWTSGDWIPEESALCIRRLEEAGAILIGKTATPEFAYASFTHSPRWGATRNPWDLERTPGGSSGGSAAAVATGVVPFAEGTDMGGSVRIPAAFCGVVGLKPSLGRIPMTILPSVFDNISHFGPLARTVGDAVAFMEAASGPSDEDIMSLPLSFSGEAARRGSLEGRRFAFSIDLGYYEIQPEVAAVMREAIGRIRELGAVVDEVPMHWTRAVNDQWFDLWCVFMSSFFGERLIQYRHQMDPVVVSIIERGLAANATDYKRVELLRTSIWRDMAKIFETYDALLCPTCAITAPSVQENDDDYVATLPNGKFAGLDMTCPFNLLPQLPALSLPAGRGSNGLPVGLQIIGRRFADEQVLSFAAAMESSLLLA
ncbi:amidase [Rhizobium rhizogenes]|uniref:amidase n=1 Tax=Rhizobium rhizogenes TaxID=359 RepID=UPI0015745A43|nr:amidase family protein [Rhizobium rhizogenes]NTF45945.1 amidase [Rhizobium rhizogenes]